MALELIRKDLSEIADYTVSDEIFNFKLDANESPASPLSSAILKLNRYPTLGIQNNLRGMLARQYQVDFDELVLTRGSDEGIDLIIRLFLEANKDSIMQCPPTFFMYSFFACMQGANIINCPLDSNFDLDEEAIKEQWKPNCKLIFICRPNNPTGSMINISSIQRLCEQFKRRAMLIVDEAYIEFSEEDSAISLIKQFDNLIILRTLSKAYGLAGLRLGAIISQAKIISAIQKIITPFSLATPVMQLASNALTNQTWLINNIKEIKKLRDELESKLSTFSFIEKVYPSSANFILIKSTIAQKIYLWLKQNNIATKIYLDNPNFNSHLRITIGNAFENAFLLKILNRLKV